MAEYAMATSRLTRRFGELTAVDSIDLHVEPGSIYGFLGPNGAGKTTTIRLLLGLIRPDAGEVRLFGRSLSKRRFALLRRVGALVEQPSLYPHLTGRENLEVTRRLVGGDRESIGQALRIAGLEEAADRRVGEYSTGMQQRLGLALALLGEPELLILDEPTNGLDPAGMREMRKLICRLPGERGVTVFLSSHLLSEVEQVATHVGIINQGKLLFQGAPDQLRAQLDVHVALAVDRPEEAMSLLSREGWSVRRDGNHGLTVGASGRSDASLVNAQLVQAGLSVYHLSLDQPSLEDVLLSLTEGPVLWRGRK